MKERLMIHADLVAKRRQKACSKCGEIKPYAQFYRQRSHSTGRRSECIVCFWRRQR